MSEWQPIETAPRDPPQDVLIGFFDAYGDWRVKLAFWASPYEGCSNEQCFWGNARSRDEFALDHSVHGVGATHWMPLPNPPTCLLGENDER